MNDTNRTNRSTNQANILHKELCYMVVGCLYDVRNLYGSGQKELVYQNALAELLAKNKLPFEREVLIKIRSKLSDKTLGNYRLDFVIDKKIIVEIKVMKFTPDKIQNQLFSYLFSTTYEVGYLVNFGSSRLYLKRVILTNDRKHISFNS
ncbi:hypothetical protein A2Z33_04270 [Candidatus Gottesmanbacteria bacterium RBG_16_52_11]|uniref:GxxExxY protein n=1 Tax=Candidatus Gottesmanbacteria bacterium RBG_16_52_11 TaxID=1798374 RepID=A0A1F5YW63_9BACT|nr:MAG: hypothetical protein A2Z33_04270 [Candidatus Gottesmanbacteria bacterium RBG_16_52_11]